MRCCTGCLQKAGPSQPAIPPKRIACSFFSKLNSSPPIGSSTKGLKNNYQCYRIRPASTREKSPPEAPKAVFFVLCVWGGGNQLTIKNLKRFGATKKMFPERPNATPDPAPNRVETRRGPNEGGFSSAVTVRAATVSGAGGTGQAIGSNGRTRRDKPLFNTRRICYAERVGNKSPDKGASFEYTLLERSAYCTAEKDRPGPQMHRFPPPPHPRRSVWRRRWHSGRPSGFLRSNGPKQWR